MRVSHGVTEKKKEFSVLIWAMRENDGFRERKRREKLLFGFPVMVRAAFP